MDINIFISSFSDLFEETNVADFDVNSEFRDLDEWDSFLAMSLIAMLDSEFGVKLSGDEIKSANTIGELFNIVKNKK
ncbi:MAG: hypothetical protein QG594_239 [Bacteroidota bacterium]|nr:hypothetical protein [Bacteroidota bacterium]